MEKLMKVLDVVKNVILWILALIQKIVGKLLLALADWLEKKPQEWNTKRWNPKNLKRVGVILNANTHENSFSDCSSCTGSKLHFCL